MASYRPSVPFTTSMVVLAPTIKKVAGVRAKVYPEKLSDGFTINGAFRTFGGTERTVDGVLAIEDTASVETWYRSDITSDCQIALPTSGARYEIINEPENIEQRNQFLKFMVRRVKGGV